jgi:arylsulfatase A-like enzyme
VNDQRVGSVTIRSNRGGQYRIAVPGSFLRAGENVLAFDFAWSARPVDVTPDSGDRRPLSVMFDQIAFHGLLETEKPEILNIGAVESLRLPPRSAVSFFDQMPAGSSLWLGAVVSKRAAGQASCVLEIGIETESGLQLTELARPDTGEAKPVRFDIGSEGQEIVGIRFSVRSAKRTGDCRDALEIFEPHVTASPSADMESATGGVASVPPWIETTGLPNILIYLVDCLRADHLGAYGYARNVSPNIDRFAGDSVTFTRAISASSWTRPSVASLLTGMSPQAHATRGDREALSDSVPLLQEILQKSGYATVAVITNGVVSTKFGFGRGFDDFRFLPEQHKKNPEIHQLSDRANAEIFEWLEGRDTSKPFFMYVHSTDPHAPYLPRSPFREAFAADADPKIGLHSEVEALTQGKRDAGPEVRQDLIDLYDGEIAFNDDQFGRLLRYLENEGLYDNTLIVLTADHGEEFGDHGRWQHGFTLYQEQLHVPLVVKQPDGYRAGRRRTELVSLIDVAPTLLEAAGVDVLPGMMGRSLRPWSSSENLVPQERPVFADLAREPQWRALNAVILGKKKLILNHSYDVPRPRRELYNLALDPVEKRNIRLAEPVVVEYLETHLRRAASVEPFEGRIAELSPEDEEKLRALGYLQ